MLKIYNTHTKQKENFKPNLPNKIGMYVCGVTVYDYCHVGHARTYISFDMIYRYLKFKGYEVKYVRNITDIDDKIIKKSQENNENWQDITKKFIQAMHEDLKILNLQPPTFEPKATDFMPQMIDIVKKLQAKDYAYVGSNGDVFYTVKKNKNYGYVSGKKIEDLQVGARVNVNDAKKDPLDFVLWKLSNPNEPHWDSPWGNGRPGWHLECSAMSMHYLGETFDIHGGGSDLMFPHHENECAQTEAITNKKFVNTWIHTGHLQLNKEKMSKSLGNFFTIREVLKTYHPEVLKYFMLCAHYRSPLEYSVEHLELAKGALDRLYSCIRDFANEKIFQNIQLTKISNDINLENEYIQNLKLLMEKDTKYEENFYKAMDDDFNTPEALAVIFDLVKEINIIKQTTKEKAFSFVVLLKYLTHPLGILEHDPNKFFHGDELILIDKKQKKEKILEHEMIENMINQRLRARKEKNWALADQIRDELSTKGIILEDSPSGTTWKKI